MREILIKRLQQDLVGPFADKETLTSRPGDVYLTGMLWPMDSRMSGEDDEKLGLSDGGDDSSGSDAEEEEVPLTGTMRPSAAGISFAVASENNPPHLEIVITFATYEPVTSESGKGSTAWHRKPFRIELKGVKPDKASETIDLQPHGAPPDVKLHLRTLPWNSARLVTATLVNMARPAEPGRELAESLTLFQTSVEIRPVAGTTLVARPSRRSVVDEDDKAAAMLYRNALEFAVGHTCSARWTALEGTSCASLIATDWIPTSLVPATSTAGHAVFRDLSASGTLTPLSADWLATAPDSDLSAGLLRLPDLYEDWIREKEKAVPQEFAEQAKRNLQECRKVADRIRQGVNAICADKHLNEAFRLANLAMATQYRWSGRTGTLMWRPFQLGFLLLTAGSTVQRGHAERDVMDLLWFPTGGGKTEAYLGLIAFTLFHRRLSQRQSPDNGAGVAALMRYTLRLLTTQQFSRAAALILACEAIRRGKIASPVAVARFGRTPFSIGLWVGGDATPNKVADAAQALAGAPDKSSPVQLTDCPSCSGRLVWFHNQQDASINARCDNRQCTLWHALEPLPVWTVDEDVYRMRPSLLIGTIDKYAQIVFRPQVSTLFSIGTPQTPDLIIQDELHLIAGPLGTVAALYEVAIDRMFADGEARPKVIGSTATIRRASEQVHQLFCRATTQFPPPGLDDTDSGFAVIDPDAPGRLYAAITTAGRSAKFTLQASAASLLQTGLHGAATDAERDPYWTLVTYFNSLRELGGALVLMQDDVNDALANLAALRTEPARTPRLIEELTSRRSQNEVRDMLTRLGIRAGNSGALDAVLATNMLSVGVDIPRLGLMLVNGQPKGMAEYIQATSRVGRGQVPGLVVVVLNNAKSRDRSHYESFSTWHSTLYRDVEPTSVTPFASRARDRALHAVLVSLSRHLIPGLLDRPDLDAQSNAAMQQLIDDIVSRAAAIDPQETDVRTELEELRNKWVQRAPPHYWQFRQAGRSLLQSAERAATMRAMGRLPGDAWPTLNNMRSVEASTRYRLAEFLRAAGPNTTRRGSS